MSDLVQWDTIRAINLSLSLLALAAMVWRRPYFRQQDPPVHLLLMILAVLISTNAYGSAEQLITHDHEPGGPRVLLVTAATVIANVALLRARPARLRPPPHDRAEP